MTKEQIVLFYSIGITVLLLSFMFLTYFKNKKLENLRLKIEELDAIYFDEIKALEDIIEKYKSTNNLEKERLDLSKEENKSEQEVGRVEKN